MGIGTYNPAAKLDVAGTIKIADGSQGAGKVLTSDAAGLATWASLPTAEASWNRTGNGGTTISNFLGTTDNTSLRIRTNNVQRAIIDSTGNMGIGTTIPNSKLHVLSSDSFISNFDGGQNMWIALSENGVYRGYLGSYAGNPEDVDFGTGSGTTGKLHLTIGAVPKFTIDNTGNVGIGTINPVAKLDVAGTIKITDGTQGAGKVLTSDANGLATWAVPVGANTIGPIAGGSNPNGANITGSTLVLTPANENNGGVVTNGTQTFGGSKSFNTDVNINGLTIGRGPLNQLSNTVIGSNAAQNPSGGPTYDNTIIGYRTALNFRGIGQTAIGKGALSDNWASYQTAIGVEAMQTGIGGSGKSTAIGYRAMANGTGTGENTAIGYNAMTSSTYYNSGTGNTAIGANTIIKDGLFESTAIGYGAKVESSQSLVLGVANTKVGIGTTIPQYPLDVVSSANNYAARIYNTGNNTASIALILRGGDANGSGGWLALFQDGNGNGKGTISFNGTGVQYNTTSDIRLKKNITDSKLGMDALKNIQVKDYQYKDNDKVIVQGFLAQQLYEVYPQAVTKGTDEVDENGKLTHPWMVDYGKLTPLLVKSVQEQQVEIEAQKADAAKQKAEYEARLKALEEKLNKLLGTGSVNK